MPEMSEKLPQMTSLAIIFSAVISASLVRRSTLDDAVALAARFIRKCISVSDDYNIPLTDGVAFEDVLYMLTPRRHTNNH